MIRSVILNNRRAWGAEYGRRAMLWRAGGRLKIRALRGSEFYKKHRKFYKGTKLIKAENGRLHVARRLHLPHFMSVMENAQISMFWYLTRRKK